MSTVRVGTDIVEVGRIKKAAERTGQAFLDRVFTPEEQEYCMGKNRVKWESLAARFAAKEAFSKAVGTGICENAQLREIRVANRDNGRPYLILSGATYAYFREHFGDASIDVSISHTSGTAVATVVICSDRPEEIGG